MECVSAAERRNWSNALLTPSSNLPRSSRNDQEKLAQITETFPDEDPEKLDQALKDARGNYTEAVRITNASRAQSGTSPMQFGPRKLQRPAQR